jgi:hypothetical protein
MKIIELRVENLKRISVVTISPTGNMVEISSNGENAQGKTTVLDAIWWVIKGSSNIQAQPIRKGCEKAEIRAKIGDKDIVKYIATRRFTAKGSTIIVESPDGAKFGSPQGLLDSWCGDLAFDPLEFMRLGEKDPRKQLERLRSMVTLDVDIEALDRQNKVDYEARTGVNREAATLSAQLESFPAFPADLPAQPIDTRELAKQIAEAGQHNADIDTRRRLRQENIRKFEDSIADIAREVSNLRRKADGLRREAAAMDLQADERETEAAGYKEALSNIPAEATKQPIDVHAVQRQLEEAQIVNQSIQRKQQRDKLAQQVVTKESQSKELTRAMEEREKQKIEAIARAKMPVVGLGFGDGYITFNGLPLDQASDAEQLRISCAIAMAANPKLRVLRIRDGSLLSTKSKQLLAEMAEVNNYQCWIETVVGGPAAIVLEDGHVKE